MADVGYWIDEFHMDGLRLDATQDIHDSSGEHILTAMARRAREAAGERSILVVGENEPQRTKLVQPPARGGYGIDALWNDDFHHSAMVALTGRREAYYSDYLGQPGADLGGEVGLSVPGAALRVAGQASRRAGLRPGAGAVHQRATFERSKLDPAERERHAEAYALTRGLLRLRRQDPALGSQRRGGGDGAVMGPESLVLRFFAGGDPGDHAAASTASERFRGDRLLLINLGTDLRLAPVPEPLLAPPQDMRWTVLWTSEAPDYGGSGTPPLEPEEIWYIPGHAAVVLAPASAPASHDRRGDTEADE